MTEPDNSSIIEKALKAGRKLKKKVSEIRWERGEEEDLWGEGTGKSCVKRDFFLEGGNVTKQDMVSTSRNISDAEKKKRSGERSTARSRL